MKIYHHNDADGRCSAAIAFLYLTRIDKFDSIQILEVDYDKVDETVVLDDIGKDETIYILDFSFKPELMAEVLKKTENVIWIDHHKTAMEYDYGRDLVGLQKNTEGAGCELTWKWFMQSAEVPDSVKYIGDRDTWTWKYGEVTAQFFEGLKTYSHQPKDVVWVSLLLEHMEGRTPLVANKHEQIILKTGVSNLAYRNAVYAEARSRVYETTFEGIKAIVINMPKVGSEIFGDLTEKYDMGITFLFNGKRYIFSLFGFSEDVDVASIAEKHGGGGHKGAAGFDSEEIPFKIDEEEDE